MKGFPHSSKIETSHGMKNISISEEEIFTKNIFTMMHERSMIAIIEALFFWKQLNIFFIA
jgi:hypothetical protein